MNFGDSLDISASGLNAQKIRMDLISSNLANINTTKTREGGPYKRKDVVFSAVEPNQSFDEYLQYLQSKIGPDNSQSKPSEVKVVEIFEDSRPPIIKYDPYHPDADKDGYIKTPNISVIEEMVNMISASRSYEANVAAISTTKRMAARALEIGR